MIKLGNSNTFNKMMNFAVYFYIYLLFFHYITGDLIFRDTAISLGFIVFFIDIVLFKKKYLGIYIITATLFLGCVLNIIYTGTIYPSTFIFISGVGLGISIHRHRLNYMIVYLIFISFSLYFFKLIITGIPPSLAFEHHSRNFVSVVMLFSSILLYITAIENLKKISVIPALITFLISFWGKGRGGVIISGLLLIGICLYILNLYRLKDTKAKVVLYFMIIIGLALLFVFSNYVSLIYNRMFDYSATKEVFSRMKRQGLHDSVRYAYVKYYLKHSDVYSLFFGQGGRIAEKFRTTAHNSFLEWHERVGIACISIYIFILYAFIKSFFYDKLRFLLLFVILLRAGVDSLLFNNGVLFDLILYSLLMSIMNLHVKKSYGTFLQKFKILKKRESNNYENMLSSKCSFGSHCKMG